jgi:hypothetical protein
MTEEEKKKFHDLNDALDILYDHIQKMNKIMKYYKRKRVERKIEKMREGQRIIFYDDTNATITPTQIIKGYM